MVSLAAMSAHRASVFTFESSVHSSHVLRRLDELRQRDTLCDVTVVVEGQSFRAHRSVLASCSEYFTQRISALTQHGAVITLPQEVTVAGFEPLLQFAYTSKLLFGKENVLEIRNSASILGIRDLEDACFEFLLPKFFPSNTDSAPFLRKTCCKKKCKRRLSKDDRGIISDNASDGKELKPAADSPSQQEVAWHCNKAANSKMGSQNSASSLTPVSEGTNDLFMQCPKYRRQLACGKEPCVSERSVNNPAAVIRDNSDLSCSHRSSCASSKNETEVELSGNSTSNPTGPSKGGSDDSWKSKRPDEKNEADVAQKETNERQGKVREEGRNADVSEDVGYTDRLKVKTFSSGPSAALAEASSGLIMHHCPLKTSVEGSTFSGSVGHKSFVMDLTAQDRKAEDSGLPVSIDHKAEKPVEAEWKRAEQEREAGEGKGGETGSMEARERSTTEKEVAEHMARRLGCDLGSSQPCYPDSDAGSSSDSRSARGQSTSLEWLNFHVNLRSTSNVCPFLQDLDQSKCLWKGAELSECEGASQSGVSSLNSGEDGDSETETEGDSESSARERARQVQLPFSVDWIVDLSRNDFQQLLKQQVLTREQLEFVHDMRRRSKNRLAAQRCRKRKLDCIYNLQCEINKLKTEREKLMMEKSQLGQLKLKTCHSVSALFQRVCSEANLQPEQLQVLSKYTSSDCPLASYLPHMDTLLSQPRLPVQAQASVSASSAGLDEHMVSEESSSSCSRDTAPGGGQHPL